MDEIQKHKQRRPSVLRHVPQAASRQQHGIFYCLLLRMTGDLSVSPRIPEGMSALFVSGLCRWPGCGVVSENFSTFLKHLHSEHRHNDKSIAQWRVQQDIVQYMERQVNSKILRKADSILADNLLMLVTTVLLWTVLFPNLSPKFNKLLDLSLYFFASMLTCSRFADLFPGIECYKYNNIRPPYTYAYLIRWSILESPDKQRTLNEIYNWFTTMFFYFRHNTATWKNAIRHNLSLHKCFVRVEGEKGAVWTVDETEYQRRKGQKYHRDCPVKWLTSYSHFCSEEPTAADSSTVSLLLSRC
uniref:Forkhead box protein P3-like n=1 Tax=Poecilia latipinna TaxID=48699 RepID=A0A3B3V7M2_9TELE